MLPAALEAAIVRAKEEGKVGPLACALLRLQQQVRARGVSVCLWQSLPGRCLASSFCNKLLKHVPDGILSLLTLRLSCCARLWEQPSGLDHSKLSDMLAAAVLCGDHSRNHCPGRV